MTTTTALEDLLSGLVAGDKFKLDDRTTQAKLEFIREYAQLIPYQGAYTWADILFMGANDPQRLAEIYQDKSLAQGALWPHQALLLAFLELLETPRALLNYFPYAHRELYYRRLLGLSERAAEPASVALSFELAANESELLIPLGTLFAAGQDSQGAVMRYALDRPLLANQSAWTDLRWCWRPESQGLAMSYLAYEDSNDLLWPDTGLRLFSDNDQAQNILTGRLLVSAALDTPAEPRTFVVTLFSPIDSADVTLFQVSSGDCWLPLEKTPLSGSTNTLTFSLTAEAGAVTPPDNLDGLTFEVPVLRLGCGGQQAIPKITRLQVTKGTGAAVTADSPEQYVLTPYGYREEPEPNDERFQLYLGFSGIQPGQTLSLYWQLQGAKVLPVEWQYLSAANQWGPLADTVLDETVGLFRSGLWSVVLPVDASQNAPSMPMGRYWLRALMPKPLQVSEVSDYPFLGGLISNAMTATLQDAETLDAKSLSQPLAANSISQPESSITGLWSTEQPWPSWGGRPQETIKAFFDRVAHHLSHRNRALTWQDMVTILKTQFKAVLEVATPDSIRQTELPAILVQPLIVIPLNTERDNDDSLRPMFNEASLEDMANYLRAIASPWQTITVNNPEYRNVAIEYDVSFHSWVNPDYGYRQLRQALEQHYMPWGGEQPGDIELASRLDYYDVMARIQQQSYVNYVVNMSLGGGMESIQAADGEVLILVWS